jgi:sodium/proline symporter
MNTMEVVVFIVYLAFMIGIGLFFFIRSKNAGEKEYFLGGRKMGPWVSALSAGASDMSAWVLMGLPTAIYALGLGQLWIPVGLALGYALSWIFEAPRLRAFSIVADDAITIPQYLTRRFRSKSYALQVTCAIIFLVAYTIYAASSIKAAGTLFSTVIGMDAQAAMYLAAGIIIAYTFLGGFKAVCWTDLLQGMLMVVALVVVPIAAVVSLGGWGEVNAQWDVVAASVPHYTDIFYDGGVPLTAITIISLLVWGLGYFGMPHIIVRYTAIKNPNDLKISRRVATIWIVVSLACACLVGLIGRAWMEANPGTPLDGSETIFLTLADTLFPTAIAGIIFAAILAAVMSTADSQLLVASSCISNDLYKRAKKKEPGLNDKQLMWLSRIIVAVIAIIAAAIALSGNNSIMSLVSFAWGGFGSAFGPLVILALFWKRANAKGALAGMIVGFLTAILWNTFLISGGIIGAGEYCIFNTQLYELAPGFLFSMIAMIVVSLLTEEPPQEVLDEYETFEKEMEKLASE